MRHPVYKVKGVEVVGPYRLRIEFTDGLVRTIDFRSILEGEVYAPLQDLDLFAGSRSTAKPTHSSGRTVPTSTLRFCTTGPTTKLR